MPALDHFHDQLSEAVRLMSLEQVLENRRQQRLQAKRRKTLARFFRLGQKRILDLAGGEHLQIAILDSGANLDRSSFSKKNLAILLRQAIVVAVSAFESYYQECFRDHCYEVYRRVAKRIEVLERSLAKATRPRPAEKRELSCLQRSRILKFPISLADSLRYCCHEGSRPGHHLKQGMLRSRSGRSLQSPSDIQDLFKAIDLVDLWKQVAAHRGMKKPELTGPLERINSRRNQIIHCADREETPAGLRLKVHPQSIQREEVKDVVDFLSRTVHASDIVVRRHVNGAPKSVSKGVS